MGNLSIFGTFILSIAQLVDLILNIYTFILIGRALISWVGPDPYNPIVRFLHNATDPVLDRVRRVIPFAVYSGIDFSPIIVLLALNFIRPLIGNLLLRIAYSV